MLINIAIAQGYEHDFQVDYDPERGMYRVSIFTDNHWHDEFWFDAYGDKEITRGEKSR